MLGADDFRNDPYGYLTNQAGHAYLVGAPLSVAVAPLWGLILAPVIVAVVYGIVWEIIVQRGRLWRDSFEDTVHVLAGGSVICAALSGDYATLWGCFAAQAVLLSVGVWRRT